MATHWTTFIQCKGGQGDRAEPRGTACEMPLRCAQQPAALPAPIARDLSVCGADRALCDCVRVEWARYFSYLLVCISSIFAGRHISTHARTITHIRIYRTRNSYYSSHIRTQHTDRILRAKSH